MKMFPMTAALFSKMTAQTAVSLGILCRKKFPIRVYSRIDEFCFCKKAGRGMLLKQSVCIPYFSLWWLRSVCCLI